MRWFRRRRDLRAERSVPLAEAMEPRLLFSADIAAGLALGAAADVAVEQRTLTSTGEYAGTTAQAAQAAQAAAYAAMPLAFEENAGQYRAGIDFTAYGSGYAIGLGGGEAWLSLAGPQGQNVVHLDLQGAREGVQAQGEGLLAARSNVYLGNDASAWRADLANYASVLYRGVYEGVDVRYYGAQRQLEYDFVVAAGADAGAIRLRFEGVASAGIAADGDLVLRLQGSDAELRFQAPVSYQRGDEGREAVASRYVIHEDGSIGFELGDYDRARELVIDPVLDYATYLGGSGAENATGIAVDASGNVYVTGRTASSDFPAAGGGSAIGAGGDGDMYVARFNETLTALQFSTRIGGRAVLLGGAGDEQGKAIAVDGSGNVIVTGWTSSSNFPTTAGAQDSTLNGAQDAVVVKLDASGGLQFSTYVGGNGGTDTGNAVVADADGNFYVAGQESDSGLLSGVLSALLGSSDNAFIHKYGPTGDLLFGKLFGGNANDAATGLALSGPDLFVVGNTQSANVPMVNGHQMALANTIDGFLARLSTSTGDVNYATYVGSTEDDTVTGVATDSSGRAWLVGVTRGRNSNPFATTAGAWRTTSPVNNADTGFLRIYDTGAAPASQLVYSTYLGGNDVDRPTGIAVAKDRAVVVGNASSTSGLATAGALDTSNNDQAMYVLVLHPLGGGASDLEYATYYGQGMATGGVAVRGNDAYVAGGTSVAGQGSAGSAQPALAGGGDAFVLRLAGLLPNVAPVLDLNGAAAGADVTAAFTEQTPVLVAPAATLADVDSATLQSLTVTLTARPDGDGVEWLWLDATALAAATGAGLAVDYTHPTGVLAITGTASVATYQAVLRGLQYRNDSNTPTLADRTLTIVANDGAAASVARTATVGVTAVNDAPVVSVPGPQATPEDTDLVFPGGQVVVSDVDAGNGTVQVSITVTHGTVSLGGTLVSAGGEFRINTTASGIQSLDADSRQAVAMDAAGNFVVVWQSDDGSGTGIYAQRFNAAGVPQGAEFRVNATTNADQGRAVVAMDAAGNFVVAWESDGQDGTSWGVYARRYDAAGNALAGEFQVAASGAAAERYPSIAMSASGQFVIAWHVGDPSGALATFDVHARRFDAAGNALGSEFRVNTTTTDGQLLPAVAMDAAGNFVVVWQSRGQDGNGYAVMGQRYDASGNALGGEFQVNTTSSGDQWHAGVAMNAAGSFVVVWEGEGAGDDDGIFARRYDAAGNALGGEFRVNTTHQRAQLAPSVGIDDAGGFTVSWNTKLLDDGNSQGVFLQRYGADGSAIGGETLVNATVAGDQENATLAMTGGGDFVVVWSGNGTGDGSGIFGQRYDRLPGLAFGAGNGMADTTMVFTGTLADVNAALAGLRFRPDADYAGPASVQIAVNDLGNTGGAAQVGSAAIAIDVAPVNDAPVLALVRLDVTEGGTVVLGPGNVVIADPDSASFTYTVSGLAGGSFQVYDGVAWNTAGSFTSAQLAAGQVRFVDDGDELPPAFSLTASDGSASGNTRAAIVSFTKVNDAPVLTGAQLAVAEGGTTVLSAANFTVADPDGSSFTYTVSSVVGGTLQVFVGTTWNTATTFTSAQLAAGRVRFVDDADEVPPSFSVAVSDGALASNTVAAAITFTPVNDPPVLASASLAVTEGGTVTLAAGNFAVTDPDNGAFTYTISGLAGGSVEVFSDGSWSAAASFTSAQVAAGQVRFVDDGDELPPSLSLTVSDGMATGNTLAVAVTFTAVNDAPVLASAQLAVAEGATVVLGPADFAVSDPDSGGFSFTVSSLAGGTFQVWDGSAWNDAGSFTSAQIAAGFVRFVDDGDEVAPSFSVTVDDGAATGNTLAAAVGFTSVNDAPVLGTATLAVTEGATVPVTAAAFGVTDPDSTAFTYTISGLSGGTLEVFSAGSWSAATTFTSAQLAAGFVRFVDDGDESAPAFSVTVSDGVATGNTLAAAIAFTPVNDAPVLAPVTLAVSEGGTVVLAPGDFAVTDADSSAFTYTISGLAGGTFEVFSAGSWSAATSFTSAQLAAGEVRFVDDGDEAAPAFSLTASDGTATGNTLAAAVNFTPANDAPVLTGAALAVTEGGTVILDAADFGVSDPDSAAFTYTVSALAGGTLQVFDGAAWSNATRFTSTQLAAGQVRFVDDGDESAPSFDVTVNDGMADSNTVAAGITYVPVADAPVLSSASLAVAEGGIVVLGAGDVVVADADSTAFMFQASGVTGGTFQIFDGTRWTGASVFSSAQLAAGAVRFVHDGGEAAPAFTLRVSDGVVAGNALAGTVRFTPVNDAPAITGPAAVSIGENTVAVATMTAEDPDSPAQSLTWSLVGGDDAGLFTIDQRTGVLSFRAGPDFERPADRDGDNVYRVVVQVSDGSLAATWALGVAVSDADDGAIPPAPPPVPQPPAASDPPAAPAPAPGGSAPAPAPARPEAMQRPAGAATLVDQSAGFAPASDAQLVPAVPLPSFAPASPAGVDAAPESTRLLHTVAFVRGDAALIAPPAEVDLVFAHFGIDSRGESGRIEELQRSLRSGPVADELDRLREGAREEMELERSFTVSVAGVSLGLSVLYILWLIRGGVLLGSYLSALPAWRILDPLPVLSRVEDDPEEDEDGIAELDGDSRDALRGFGGAA